jgi:hypothetical protein
MAHACRPRRWRRPLGWAADLGPRPAEHARSIERSAIDWRRASRRSHPRRRRRPGVVRIEMPAGGGRWSAGLRNLWVVIDGPWTQRSHRSGVDRRAIAADRSATTSRWR